MEHKFDAIDIQLLKLLQEGGRSSNAELAAAVGLSPSACLRRIQQLEAQGVIAGYHAELNPKQIQLGLTAFIRVTMVRNTPQYVDQFIRSVNSWSEVVACYSVTGDSDYLLHVVTENLDVYSRFLMTRLLADDGVASVNSSVVLDILKQSRVLPLGHLVASE